MLPMAFNGTEQTGDRRGFGGGGAAYLRYGLQGVGNTDIARRLNSEGVLTPGSYFRQKNPGSGRFRKASEKNGWTAASVLNILHQYEYTGALVGRKRYKASLHEKRTVPQDKADWIIYEGAHGAIISKADFNRVQEIIRQRPRRAKGTPQEYPLKGLLKGGSCHRTLSRVHSSAGYYYRCTKSRADENSDCLKGKLFSEKEMQLFPLCRQPVTIMVAGIFMEEKVWKKRELTDMYVCPVQTRTRIGRWRQC